MELSGYHAKLCIMRMRQHTHSQATMIFLMLPGCGLQSFAEGAREAVPGAAEQGPLVGTVQIACCRRRVEGRQLVWVDCVSPACLRLSCTRFQLIKAPAVHLCT